MRRALVLAEREFRAALDSPTACAAVLFFLLSTSIGFFYVDRFFLLDESSLRSYFATFPLAMAVVVPALTMRAWAEERRSGTAELLFSLPFSEAELVAGKFLASYAVLCAALLLSFFVPLCLSPLGYFDPGVTAAEYLGAFLMGAAAVSVGLFASSLARSQMSALLLSLTLLLSAMAMNRVASSFGLSGPLADLLNLASLAYHFDSFARGVLDSRDIAYFILATLFFLFLNARVLLLRKWS